MSVRRTIVEAELDGLNVTEFCAQHGISTWFFYDLRRRFQADSSALEPRSRAPKRVANRFSDDRRDTIVRVRKELADAGMDHGPASIWSVLEAVWGETTPSESTIWRVLTERGAIEPQPAKAPKRTWRSFAAERANECWQIDSTHWSLADETSVEIIDIIDDCSRLAICNVAVASCTTATAWDAVCVGAKRWGWPMRVLSDNGSAFRGDTQHGGGGIEANLVALGIPMRHSRPYHPQTCGKVERFHQTLKRFLTAQPPPESIHELQDQIDAFTERYNQRRKHRSLARRTPLEVWTTTPRAGPEPHPLDTPTRIITRTIVNTRFELDRTCLIALGTRYNGQTATAVITGQHAHVFIDGKLIRELTIDPTRTYQPIHNRPGHPPRL
ncbi:MAG: integrase core domain-containing protein [Mycobacteriaceae bacterium]